LSYGYACGGSDSSGSIKNSIEKMVFANEAITLMGVTLNANVGYSANRGASNSVKGYILGGYNGTSLINAIKGFVFSSETSADPSATLTNAVHRSGCIYNNTDGYLAGGTGASTYSNIDRFTYNTETKTATGQTLSSILYELAGISGMFKGYFTGGDTTSSNLNVIRGYTYDTQTAATIAATMALVRKNASDLGIYTDGYLAGGDSGVNPTKTYTATIDKLNFATETVAASNATLSVARTSGCGLYPDVINNSDIRTRFLAHFDS
jgi:hypothetical protein